MSTSQPASQPYPGQVPGGAAPAPKKKSKGPMILMILGGLILLLSIIVGIILTVIGVGTTGAGMNEIKELPGGSGSVTVEAGDVMQLYTPEQHDAVSCSIMTPDGSEPGEGTSQESSVTLDGTNWVSFASFEATTSGEHMISCEGDRVAVGPPVSIGGIFGAIGGILLGIGGGILGFLLLLAGLIWWLIARKKTA